MDRKLKVAITQGDINGTSYEVLFKAFENDEVFDLFTPIVYGSVSAAQQHRDLLQSPARWNVCQNADSVRESRFNLIDLAPEEPITLRLGSYCEKAARLAQLALERATNDLKSGKVDVLVTLPPPATCTDNDGDDAIDHTAYLAREFGGEAQLILANERIRIAFLPNGAPNTQQRPTNNIDPETLATTEHALRMLHRTLLRDFCVTMPRIALLNTNSALGNSTGETSDAEQPLATLVKQLNAQSVPVFGPYEPKSFFEQGHYRIFDAVLTEESPEIMAAFRDLCNADGVRLTTGLNLVRTAPQYFTEGCLMSPAEAQVASLLQAIYTAIDVLRRRSNYDEATANPLPITPRERRDDRRRSV